MTQTPPFDWESWYEACGGRVDHTPQASKIVAKGYNEQAPKFTGLVENAMRPFGSPDQASQFVKDVAIGTGAAAVGIARIEPGDVYAGRSIKETYAIAIGQRMLWKHFQTVPSQESGVECCRVYYDLGEICIAVADALRERGYPARV